MNLKRYAVDFALGTSRALGPAVVMGGIGYLVCDALGAGIGTIIGLSISDPLPTGYWYNRDDGWEK